MSTYKITSDTLTAGKVTRKIMAANHRHRFAIRIEQARAHLPKRINGQKACHCEDGRLFAS